MLATLRQLVPRQQDVFDFSVVAAGTTLAGYVRGQVIFATIMSVYTGVALWLIGVHFALVIAVITFVLELVPIIGAPIAIGLACTVGVTQGTTILLLAGAASLVGHLVGAYTIGIQLMSRATRVHPLVALAALLLGAQLGGVLGALFAVPVAGILNVYAGALWRARRGQEAFVVPETTIHDETTLEQLPSLGDEISPRRPRSTRPPHAPNRPAPSPAAPGRDRGPRGNRLSYWVGRQARAGEWGQHQRLARWLGEIEIAEQVAKLRRRFPHPRPRIGPPVGLGVKPLAAEEEILDQLHVGVVAEDLVVDVALARVGADDDAGHPQPVAVLVNHGRRDMVVEPTPVVPAEEDRGAVPVGPLHGRVDEAGRPCLARAQQRGGVLRVRAAGRDPCHRRELAAAGVLVVMRHAGDVRELAILLDRVEPGQRVPDAGVVASWWTGGQSAASFWQSGSVPVWT